MNCATDTVFRMTSIPADVQSDICMYIKENPDIWDGSHELEWLFHTHLIDLDWKWPWHEYWSRSFSEKGVFPRMWNNVSRLKWRIDKELGEYDHRVTLLSLVTQTLYYDFRRTTRFPHKEFIHFSPTGDEPDLIQEIISSLIAQYSSDQETPALPPYFPGDRTGWLVMNPPRTRPLPPFTYPYRADSKWLPFPLQQEE